MEGLFFCQVIFENFIINLILGKKLKAMVIYLERPD
jgi:hypothetical protein